MSSKQEVWNLIPRKSGNMSKLTIAALAFFGLSEVLASPAVSLSQRASNTTCTFTGSDGYLKVKQTKNECSTIILDSLEIPGGVTLNLEDLNDGTTVCVPLSRFVEYPQN